MVSRVVVGQGGLGVGMRFLDEGVCGCRHKLRGETDHYKLGATEAVLATQSLVVGWLIKECRLACHLERARVPLAGMRASRKIPRMCVPPYDRAGVFGRNFYPETEESSSPAASCCKMPPSP